MQNIDFYIIGGNDEITHTHKYNLEIYDTEIYSVNNMMLHF